MKKEINAFEYAPHIMQQLARGGILATVKADDKVNSITIGWGTIGIDWSRPVFQIYVRECRHSKSMLDKAGEFTLNSPLERSDRVKEILAFCGSKSGRDTDKAEALGLTLVESEKISTPAIAELPLTIECRVIYSTRQDGTRMPNDVMQRYYPGWEDNKEDVHTVYYGEIVAAYIVE